MNSDMLQTIELSDIQVSDTVRVDILPLDTIRSNHKINNSELATPSTILTNYQRPSLSIEKINENFRISENHKREIDSLKRISFTQTKKIKSVNTDAIPYLILKTHIPKPNFLEEIMHVYDNKELAGKCVIISASNNSSTGLLHISGKNRKLIHREKSPSSVNDWLLGVVLLSLVIFSRSKALYDKYIYPLIRGAFNYHVANKLYKDKNISLQKISINFNFIYILNISLFGYLLLNYYNVTITDVKIYDFLICTGLVAFLFILKYILLHLCGYIFKLKNEFSEYYYHSFLLNKVLGLFLLPLIIGLTYAVRLVSPAFIYSGIILMAFFYLLRIMKGVRIFIKKDISIFYMFLYLYTLEIFPLMIFYKYFSF